MPAAERLEAVSGLVLLLCNNLPHRTRARNGIGPRQRRCTSFDVRHREPGGGTSIDVLLLCSVSAYAAAVEHVHRDVPARW